MNKLEKGTTLVFTEYGKTYFKFFDNDSEFEIINNKYGIYELVFYDPFDGDEYITILQQDCEKLFKTKDKVSSGHPLTKMFKY